MTATVGTIQFVSARTTIKLKIATNISTVAVIEAGQS